MKSIGISKERFLAISRDSTMNVLPILHAYHNYQLGFKHRELTYDEFSLAFGQWMQIPMVAVNMPTLIENVITATGKILENQ